MRSPRSLPYAALRAWLVVMIGLVAFFGTGHHFGFARDSDISSVGEAMMLPVIIFGLPMAALIFGVMQPYFLVCRRLGWLVPGVRSIALGLLAAVPTFIVFFLAGRLMNRRTPRTLLEDIEAVLANPQRLPIVLGLFVVAGLVFAWSAARPARDASPIRG